jgi:hypothetical protein
MKMLLPISMAKESLSDSNKTFYKTSDHIDMDLVDLLK